jgi:hypothetical protein
MAEVRLTAAQAMEVFDALAHSRRHLVRRDEMNAELHLGEVRFSPLTKLVAIAEDMLKDVLQEQAIIGAPIQHDAHPSAEWQGASSG